LDNGGIPMIAKVHKEGGKIDIHRVEYDYEENDDGEEIEKQTINTTPDYTIEDYEKLFVGKSEENEWTKKSGYFGPEYDGNALLVKCKPDRYIVITSHVFEFAPNSEIVEFYSPVGNSEVSDPWAEDIDGNIYILSTPSIIFIPASLKKEIGDMNPVEWYWSQSKNVEYRDGKAILERK
jgi:hypothetical protein